MSRLRVARIIPASHTPRTKDGSDVAMRRLIGRVVSDMVSEIEECGDGAEALDAYHRCLPDWVLMDIEMDQVDGITATREILLWYPRARVVIVSKYDDDQTREAARKAGACGYVLKENLMAIRELLIETGP
jgi:DNA-binding NarL/FixJ family response regulator